jgi:hypothetical protein
MLRQCQERNRTQRLRRIVHSCMIKLAAYEELVACSSLPFQQQAIAKLSLIMQPISCQVVYLPGSRCHHSSYNDLPFQSRERLLTPKSTLIEHLLQLRAPIAYDVSRNAVDFR